MKSYTNIKQNVHTQTSNTYFRSDRHFSTDLVQEEKRKERKKENKRKEEKKKRKKEKKKKKKKEKKHIKLGHVRTVSHSV